MTPDQDDKIEHGRSGPVKKEVGERKEKEDEEGSGRGVDDGLAECVKVRRWHSENILLRYSPV